LATESSGSRIAKFSAVEAEHFLALCSVKGSASAVESFGNATAFGSMIVHFAVRAAVFFMFIFSAIIPAEISTSSMLAIFSAVTVESGSCRLVFNIFGDLSSISVFS
jgi:hypothetical protein